MTDRSRASVAASAALALLLSPSLGWGDAPSQRSWLAPVAGSFSDPAAWSGGVPGPADAAWFGIQPGGTPFAVLLGGMGNPLAIASLDVVNQSPIFVDGAIAIAGGLTVAQVGAAPVLTIESVALQVTGSTQIGPSGTQGSLVIGAGSAATLLELAVGKGGGQGAGLGTVVVASDASLAALAGASPWTIGEAGSGTLTIESGGDVDLGATTLHLGRTGGTGTMTIAAGGALHVGVGGQVRVGSGVSQTSGTGSLTVDGTIDGSGPVYVGSKAWGQLTLHPSGSIANQIIVGQEGGYGSFTIEGSHALATLWIGFGGSGTFSAAGSATNVTLGNLGIGVSSPATVGVTNGATVTATGGSIGTGTGTVVTVSNGGTLAFTDNLLFQGGQTTAPSLNAWGKGSLLALPAVTVPAQTNTNWTAAGNGRITCAGFQSASNAKPHLEATTGGTISVAGTLALGTTGPSSSSSGSIWIGPGASSLDAASLATGSRGTLRFVLPITSPAAITTGQASIGGSIEITAPTGWTPRAPTSLLLVASPEVTSTSLVTGPSFFGFPPLVGIDASGLRAYFTDHIDGFDLPATVHLLASASIELPTTVLLDGVEFDASNNALWSFDPPGIVVRSGNTTFQGVGSGTTTATVTFGTASTSVVFEVEAGGGLPVVPMSVLFQPTALLWGNGNSGASAPALFGTVLGLRPKSLAGDGLSLVFPTKATNLCTVDSGWDLLLRDATGAFTNLTLTGEDGLNPYDEFGGTMSRDGRYVVFPSTVGATNSSARVEFVDRLTGQHEVVTVGLDGLPAVGWSWEPQVSDDGRYVLFQSTATNLVPDDTNGVQDVFLRDRLAGTTTRVSVGLDGGQLAVPSTACDLSGDGRYAVFLRSFQGWTLAYRYDRVGGTVELASPGLTTDTPHIQVTAAQVSDNGRYVTFLAAGLSQLVDGPPALGAQVFRRDFTLAETGGLTLLPSGSWVNAPIESMAISRDARVLAFTSKAGNVVPGAPGTGVGVSRLFRRDVFTGQSTAPNEAALGLFNAGMEPTLAIADQGTAIAFVTVASNVVVPETLGYRDVFTAYFPAPVTGDLDGDGVVGPADLSILLGAWGTASYDLDGDGVVGASDAAILLGAWTR